MQSRLLTEKAGLTCLCEEKAGRQLRKMDRLAHGNSLGSLSHLFN